MQFKKGMQFKICFCSFICAVIVLFAISPQAFAGTVTTLADDGPGSLRQSIAQASSGDTINFDPSLNGGTLYVTSGSLVFNKDLTVTATGQNITIDGNSRNGANYAALSLQAGSLSLSGLTVTHSGS